VKRVLTVGAVAASVVAIGFLIRTLFTGGQLMPTVDPSGGSGNGRKMIAVLPFVNLGTADEEYFADGVTDEITARLSVVDGLGVIARTSAKLYKGTDKAIREIAEELGVDYVLQGTVRWQRSGNITDESTVRVAPELTDVSDGRQMWAGAYEQDLKEIFQVQSDIAHKVVTALNVSLLEPARALIEKKPTDNMESYDFFLRGNELYDRATADYSRYREAAELYKKSIQLDPDFTLAQVRLSIASTECYFHWGKKEEDLAASKEAMNKAMALDPDLPDVHEALGSYYAHSGEHERAVWEYTQALKAKPRDSHVLREIGYVYRGMGNNRQALQSFEQAAMLDPRSAVTYMHVGTTYDLIRDYDQAEKYLRHAIELSPDESMLYGFLARVPIHRDGDVAAALEVLRQAPEAAVAEGSFADNEWWHIDILAGNYADALERMSEKNAWGPKLLYTSAFLYGLMGDPEAERRHYELALIELEKIDDEGSVWRRIGLGWVYAGLGREQEALAEADELEQFLPDLMARQGHRTWYARAQIYALAGDHEKALGVLETMMANPLHYVNWIRLDPAFASLREYPRFQNLSDKH
jgi:TolB-like protein/Tfp pilus assembly protein PilF